eukprot:1157282-Pelagomonas_calceolata.AAC.3
MQVCVLCSYLNYKSTFAWTTHSEQTWDACAPKIAEGFNWPIPLAMLFPILFQIIPSEGVTIVGVSRGCVSELHGWSQTKVFQCKEGIFRITAVIGIKSGTIHTEGGQHCVVRPEAKPKKKRMGFPGQHFVQCKGGSIKVRSQVLWLDQNQVKLRGLSTMHAVFYLHKNNTVYFQSTWKASRGVFVKEDQTDVGAQASCRIWPRFRLQFTNTMSISGVCKKAVRG